MDDVFVLLCAKYSTDCFTNEYFFNTQLRGLRAGKLRKA